MASLQLYQPPHQVNKLNISGFFSDFDQLSQSLQYSSLKTSIFVSQPTQCVGHTLDEITASLILTASLVLLTTLLSSACLISPQLLIPITKTVDITLKVPSLTIFPLRHCASPASSLIMLHTMLPLTVIFVLTVHQHLSALFKLLKPSMHAVNLGIASAP